MSDFYQDNYQNDYRDTKNKCRRCIVSGSVQGVCYRATTQRRAQALGLRGHAINLPDGRVDVLMFGASEAVDALAAWLWQGPDHAKVTDVVCEDITSPSDVPLSFDIA